MDFFTVILVPLVIYALTVPMPGPSFVVISRASVLYGANNGAAAALGTTASVAVYAVATALGISALLAALPWLANAIQIAGGAYLIYIGVTILRASLSRRTYSVGEHEPATRRLESPAASFRRGLFVGLGNPKMAAFFLGLFAPAMAGDVPMTARLAVLFGAVLIDLLYHQFLARIMARGRGIVDRAGRWFDALAGGCMAAFGCALIIRSFGKS